jgi:hypothetical protein
MAAQSLCPMWLIVVLSLRALNAHSCRCLAHFSGALEKPHKSAHNVTVDKSARSDLQ